MSNSVDWLLVLIVAAVLLLGALFLLRYRLMRLAGGNRETADLLSGHPVDTPARGLSAESLAAVDEAMRPQARATGRPSRRADDGLDEAGVREDDTCCAHSQLVGNCCPYCGQGQQENRPPGQ